MEIWKDIVGYEGFYQVSNLGRVKSLDRVVQSKEGKLINRKGRNIVEIVDANGYSRISLCKNGFEKAFKIHRLVANAFLNGEGQVNHKDGNKQNNHVSNLEFCTALHNLQHAINYGLRPKTYKRLIVCDQTGDIYPNKSVLARAVGVSTTMVSTHMNGKTKILKNKTYSYV
jgi:hypothetical protein